MTTFIKTKLKVSDVKYNIGFGISIKFPSKRKKNIKIGPETTKLPKKTNRHV